MAGQPAVVLGDEGQVRQEAGVLAQFVDQPGLDDVVTAAAEGGPVQLPDGVVVGRPLPAHDHPVSRGRRRCR